MDIKDDWLIECAKKQKEELDIYYKELNEYEKRQKELEEFSYVVLLKNRILELEAENRNLKIKNKILEDCIILNAQPPNYYTYTRS